MARFSPFTRARQGTRAARNVVTPRTGRSTGAVGSVRSSDPYAGMSSQVSLRMQRNESVARQTASSRRRRTTRGTLGKAAIGTGIGAGAMGGVMYGATRNRGRTSIYGSQNTPGQYY